MDLFVLVFLFSVFSSFMGFPVNFILYIESWISLPSNVGHIYASQRKEKATKTACFSLCTSWQFFSVSDGMYNGMFAHVHVLYYIYILYSVMHMNIFLNIYSGCGSMFDMNKENIVINTVFGRENRINAATKV